jgi:hypothetical protein
MADRVRDVVVRAVKTAKYYSIIVDSTPDFSHVDQLSFIIRYVETDGLPTCRTVYTVYT